MPHRAFRAFNVALLGGLIGSAAACSSSSMPAGSVQNVQPVIVNAGPTNTYFNGLFTNVTICVPGSSNCQTINGVLVDTGSSGLRVLSSVLSIALPQQTD